MLSTIGLNTERWLTGAPFAHVGTFSMSVGMLTSTPHVTITKFRVTKLRILFPFPHL